MNLLKMMQAAGIGCGENCTCATGFVGSLTDAQRNLLGHMIERGAEKRLEAIKTGGVEKSHGRRKSTLMDFMDQMFEDAFLEGRHGHLDPTDILTKAMMRANDIDPEATPYDGELGDALMSALDAIPESERQRAEYLLRQVIATKADNDPTRVEVKVRDDGFGVLLRKTEAPAGEDSTTIPSEAVPA